MHICLLDIDGTLVLTGGAGQTAFALTLARDFGIPDINRDVVFAGRSDRAIAMDLFRIHNIAPTEANWARFCRGYVARLEETLPTHDGHVLPGVGQLLAALAERGDVAIGLLTGNVREAARRKLSFYNLWEHFPFGGFGDEHEDRNEIAAAALSAARRHLHKNGRLPESARRTAGERPGHLVVIGDTLHDVRCGQSIGARCVGVATGHTTADVLRTAGPDVVVETLADMHPILCLFDT
jgi:phosphoglycolate phosphatase-like HAD superfamily hydrolase